MDFRHRGIIESITTHDRTSILRGLRLPRFSEILECLDDRLSYWVVGTFECRSFVFVLVNHLPNFGSLFPHELQERLLPFSDFGDGYFVEVSLSTGENTEDLIDDVHRAELR